MNDIVLQHLVVGGIMAKARCRKRVDFEIAEGRDINLREYRARLVLDGDSICID